MTFHEVVTAIALLLAAMGPVWPLLANRKLVKQQTRKASAEADAVEFSNQAQFNRTIPVPAGELASLDRRVSELERQVFADGSRG